MLETLRIPMYIFYTLSHWVILICTLIYVGHFDYKSNLDQDTIDSDCVNQPDIHRTDASTLNKQLRTIKTILAVWTKLCEGKIIKVTEYGYNVKVLLCHVPHCILNCAGFTGSITEVIFNFFHYSLDIPPPNGGELGLWYMISVTHFTSYILLGCF